MKVVWYKNEPMFTVKEIGNTLGMEESKVMNLIDSLEIYEAPCEEEQIELCVSVNRFLNAMVNDKAMSDEYSELINEIKDWIEEDS